MILKYLKNTFTILSVLVVTVITTASAAEISFEVGAPTEVVTGERFRVEFTLSNSNTQGENFTPPSITGLELLAGPTPSSGQHISITGNKQEVTKFFIYTYVFQASSTDKKATISAASITYEGKKYTTKPVNIDIIAPDSPASGNQGQPATQRNTQRKGSSKKLSNDNILLRMEVSKTNAYKGEGLIASLTLYSQVGLSSIYNAKYPAFNGFWAQELDVSGAQPRRTTLNGKDYQSQILRQWLLFPQRAGTLEIEQSEFTAMAQLVEENPSTGSMFDLFFGGGASVQNVEKRIVAAPVKIAVKELPQPAPATFAGAVGKFDLSSKLSNDKIAANSGGSIVLILSGNGNFPLIETPRITLPAAFEQYDTKKTENISHGTNGSSGSKEFEFPFIARAEGKYNIPGVVFTYFDPSNQKYVTLNSGDFNIEILHDDNPGGSSAQLVSGVTKEDLKMLGQDIRFIKIDNPQLSKQGTVFLWSRGFFTVLLLILAAFAGILFFLQRQIRERADIVKVKNKKANKVALRRLRKAKVFMMDGEETRFFEEMLRAMWGYTGDKLAIPVANLTKERIREELAAKGISAGQSEELLSLIAQCELSQYSPQAGIPMDKAYSAALDLIGRLENKV